MYKKSYIFGETTSLGILVGKGDRYLLTLQFEIEEDGFDVTYLASNRNLRVVKYGSSDINIAPDLIDYLVLPKEYSFEIADLDGELSELLYGTDSEKVVKKFFVKFEIQYSGVGDYVEEFSGYIVVEQLENPPIDKIHLFSAFPKTDILNNTYLFPKNYEASKWDPADSSTLAPNNPLNLNYTRPTGAYVKWDWIKLSDNNKDQNGKYLGLIQKIFQLIDVDVEIMVDQGWVFLGDTAPEYGTFPHQQKSGILFEDLICDHNWIGSVFSGGNHGIQTIGELLAKIAFDYGCLAIVTSQKKAYFLNPLKWDDNNVQVLDVICENPINKYKYPQIDFADITSELFELDTNELNVYKKKQWDSDERGFCPYALKNKIQGESGIDAKTISVMNTGYIHFPLAGAFSNLKATVVGSNPTKYYSLFGAKIPGFDISSFSESWPITEDGYLPLNSLLAEYNYALRGKLYNSPLKEFYTDGIKVDLTKGFYLNNAKYKIVGLGKDYDTQITKIEAVRVGVQKATSTIGPKTPPVVTGPINSIAVSMYGAEASLSYTQIGIGGVAIAQMNGGDWLEGFYIEIEAVYDATQFANFRIYDGSGDLVTLEKVKGKFTQLVSQEIRKVKKYTTADTIYMEFTSGTNTPTQGSGVIIIRKMKKEVI